MPPGRNDPCPCGTGKKYKQCCARYDAAASPLLRVVGNDTRSEMRALADAAIRVSATWEADVTPMPVVIESTPSGRHAAVLLAANDAILHLELEPHPPSDAVGIAKLIAEAIETTLGRGGAPPAGVLVRHPAVAAELGPLLREGTTVADAQKLPLLDEFAASFRQQMSGLPLPAISHPQMWAAWQLPADTLNRVFAAAAAYYNAAPWLLFGDEVPLELTLPTGARWNAVILGFDEQEIGLVLYESFDDYLGLLDAQTPDMGFNAAKATVISLAFDSRSDLPKPMRKEFTDAKWVVAGPAAYPSVWVLNTIGGGLSNKHAHELAMTLEVVSRIGELSRNSDEVLDALGTSWTDPTCGTVVRYASDDDELSLWDVPDELTSSLAEGVRADPSARFDVDRDVDSVDEDNAIVKRFAAAMEASGDDVEDVMRDEQDVDLFVQLMHGGQGVRLPAVTELDLRSFLYDLLPRKAMTTKRRGNEIRASLEKFFEYLAAREEIRYPWASDILRDAVSFETRWDSCPSGRQLNDAMGDWMLELFSDLDARVMLPANQLTGLGEWAELMGVEESRLYVMLQREWLVWRDAEIALGHRVPSELWKRLTARQAEWEQTPQSQLGGRSPSEVIAKERGTGRRAKPRTLRK